MTKRPLARLSESGWRIGDESAEYWRCSKFNVWCGGLYRPALGLCKNCLQLRYSQRKGGSSKRKVFNIFQKGKSGRRASGGGNLYISYNPKLFCKKNPRYYAYTHVLYERVTGEKLVGKKILTRRTVGLPEFEDLVVVPENCDLSENGLMSMYYVRA